MDVGRQGRLLSLVENSCTLAEYLQPRKSKFPSWVTRTGVAGICLVGCRVFSASTSSDGLEPLYSILAAIDRAPSLTARITFR